MRAGYLAAIVGFQAPILLTLLFEIGQPQPASVFSAGAWLVGWFLMTAPAVLGYLAGRSAAQKTIPSQGTEPTTPERT